MWYKSAWGQGDEWTFICPVLLLLLFIILATCKNSLTPLKKPDNFSKTLCNKNACRLPTSLVIYFEDVIALGYCSQTMAMADMCSSVRQRIVEDQEVKLSVFASRPSVRQQYWLSCVWSECFYTGLLSFAVLSISNRGSLAIIAMPEVSLFKEELQPLFTGLLIFV